METEMLLRVAAVVLAGGLLVSNLDYAGVWNRVKAFFTRKNAPVNNQSVAFLDVVKSWHILRSQCESYGLNEAVEKIDEVFPLLNVEE